MRYVLQNFYMKTFYIFRHAETYFSKNNINYGDKTETAPILEEGIPTIKRLAEYLQNIKTDANFSSTYLRCRQTVEIVSSITQKEFTFDENLRDYYTKNETIEDVVGRIKTFYDSLRTNSFKSVAICTHGYPIAMLTDFITKGKFDMNNLGNYPQPGILTVIKKKEVELVDFNRIFSQ